MQMGFGSSTFPIQEGPPVYIGLLRPDGASVCVFPAHGLGALAEHVHFASAIPCWSGIRVCSDCFRAGVR